MCASHPDGDTFVLANELGVTGSTLRNLLSGSYFRLGVRTRAAAIAKAHQLGIIPVEPEPALAAGKASTKRSGGKRQRTPGKSSLRCWCLWKAGKKQRLNAMVTKGTEESLLIIYDANNFPGRYREGCRFMQYREHSENRCHNRRGLSPQLRDEAC